MNTKYVTALLTLTAATLTSASAATLGLNNSTAGSLADGWGGGDNTNVTGSPFGAWSVSDTGGFAGFFIGDSNKKARANRARWDDPTRRQLGE